MPMTNTGRPLACNCRDAGRTRTTELFWRETRAGCPSRIIACCCGFDVRNCTVSLLVTQPDSAAPSTAIPRIRILLIPPDPRGIVEQPEREHKSRFAAGDKRLTVSLCD